MTIADEKLKAEVLLKVEGIHRPQSPHTLARSPPSQKTVGGKFQL